MAHISGLVDVPEHEPQILVTSRGTVILHLDDSTALRFRSEAAFDAFLERVDRLRAPGRDEYHKRFQSLRAVKGSAS